MERLTPPAIYSIMHYTMIHVFELPITESFPQGKLPCFPESSYLYLYPDVLTFAPIVRLPTRAAVAGRSPAQRSGGGASPSASIL
jgi:hypothetical protein